MQRFFRQTNQYAATSFSEQREAIVHDHWRTTALDQATNTNAIWVEKLISHCSAFKGEYIVRTSLLHDGIVELFLSLSIDDHIRANLLGLL